MSLSGIIGQVEQLIKPKPSAASIAGGGTKTINDVNHKYDVIKSNWYTAKPYGFKFTPRTGQSMVFFLPISPSNLQITTHFATNVIPTLYGTVEEHSEVRYYDITIQGTTGIAPRYVSAYEGPAASAALQKSTGRSFLVAKSVPLGGFFSKTIGLYNKVVDSAKDVIGGASAPETGVYTAQSGYLAFHNLYRFLLKYKSDASGADGGIGARSSDGHPLKFFNYKDNNEYDVAIKQFTLIRSAENPMLYNYQITMRAYNLRTADEAVQDEDSATRLKELGLDGIDSSSLLGEIKGTANGVKAVIGSAVGGINVLGR